MTDIEKAQHLLDKASRVLSWDERCDLEAVVEAGCDVSGIAAKLETDLSHYLKP